MAENGYFNPNDRGRFGFSQSGIFYAPYKYEGFLIGLFVAIGIAISAIVTIVILKVMRNSVQAMKLSEGRLFPVIVAAAVIAFTVAFCFVAFGFLVKQVTTGFKCSYCADEEKMILNYGKDEYTFFYEDVDMVQFDPRGFFGRINGYDVIIRINSEYREFSVCSSSFITPKSTPFYIIKERSELAHLPKDKKLTKEEQNVALNKVTNGITQEQIDRAKSKKTTVYDRLRDLMGEDGDEGEESPFIGESEFSDDVERAENSALEVSPFAGKVSPTAEGYAGDMPAASEFPSRRHEFVMEGPRERDLFEMEKVGTFHIMPTKKQFFIALILWCISGAIAGFPLAFIVRYYVGLYYPGVARFLFLAIEAAAIIWFFFHGFTHQRGRMYKYRADGRAFYLTAKGSLDDRILYSDAVNVIYKEKTRFKKPYGLEVTIITIHGTRTYQYMYPKYGHVLCERELPFDIIKQNIKK